MTPKKPEAPDMVGLSNDWERLKNLRSEDKPRQQQPPEEASDDGQELPSRRQPPRPGRTRGGRRPPPAAADAIPTTVRFDPEESSDVDRFVMDLRDDAGRRALDKAEVIREVLRLAREHEPTRKALLRRLR